MTDVNEQSFSAGAKAETMTAKAARSAQNRTASPIWRLRPAMRPALVVQTLKDQIIPKFVAALRSLPTPKADALAAPTKASDSDHVAALALGNDDSAALAYVESLVENGASTEKIVIEVLAPAACHFGEMWESDTTDFAMVTLAMSRLQRILRSLAEKSLFDTPAGHCGYSALLTTIPGEMHSFGLSIVAEFFRHDGWHIATGPFRSHDELTTIVHNEWFDVVGFSISSDRRLDELKRGVDKIRQGSRNKAVGIVLGGPALVHHPELAGSIGADLLSVDATSASQQAQVLVNQMQGSSDMLR